MFFHNIRAKRLFENLKNTIFLSKVGCICLKKDRKRSDLDHYHFLKNEHKMPSFVPIAHRVYLRVTRYVCLKSPSAPRKGNLYAKLYN